MSLSQKEQDHNTGTLKDMDAEKSEFAVEVEIDKKIQGIADLVLPIITSYLKAGIGPQVLLCHTSNKEAAWFVARQYSLYLVHTSRIADNEFFVCMKHNVEALIRSREQKREGERVNIIKL